MFRKKQIIAALGLWALCGLALTAEANDLVAYWEFNDGSGSTVADSSGNGNDGAITGAAWFSDPYRGMCLSFDGSDDYISVPDDSSLDISGAITVSAWVKLNSVVNKQTILSKTKSGGGYDEGGFFLAFRDDTAQSDGTFRLAFAKADGSSGTGGGNYGTHTSFDRVVSEKNNWQTGVWYFVAATWDGTTNSESLKIYINGAPNGNHTANQETILTNNHNLQVGRTLYTEPWNQFDGVIDDVRIYNRTLAIEEIETLYRERLTIAFKPNPIDGAIGVAPNVVLNFSPGAYAASHNIYFGTDYDYVNDAVASSPEYVGNFDSNTWAPCCLDFSSTYYWRVDEVNDPNVWKGNVWGFKTADDDGQLHVPSEYSTIQEAIDYAFDGDTVIVAPGTYTGDGNWDIHISEKAIAIRSENGPETCIIDCNDMTCYQGEGCYRNDYHIGFAFDNTADTNLLLEGFTIKNGYSSDYGSGISCFNSSPTINNCIIADSFGSGIYCSKSSPVIAGCIISNNNDSGIFCYESTPTVTNCTISENSAELIGGGLRHCNGPITNCIITGNSAEGSGGGIYDCPGPITNCTINNNSAGAGGGLHFCNGHITNCIIAENSAYCGGGMSDCYGDITNCSIIGNFAEGSGGGFAYGRGGTILNCSIIGNYAEIYGGGAYKIGSSFVSCTIADNTAGDSGGGLYSLGVDITNSILWGNVAPNAPQIYLYKGNSSASFTDIQGGRAGTGNIDIDPCFVQPGFWADINDPNIIVEPNDPNAVWLDGDYHLKSAGWRWDSTRQRWDWDDVTSQCIDAGNPGSPLAGEPLSIPDDPNNEWGQNLRINMGAFGGTPQASIPPYDWALLADLTNDGTVNLTDYAYQAADWLNSAEEQPGDLNRDGLIDTSDLALLADDWLKQTSWNQ